VAVTGVARRPKAAPLDLGVSTALVTSESFFVGFSSVALMRVTVDSPVLVDAGVFFFVAKAFSPI